MFKDTKFDLVGYTVDCKNNMTAKYSAGASVFDYGFEAEEITTAYNDGSGMVYNMPNRTTETNVTIGYNKEKNKISKGGNYSNGDFTLDIGASVYAVVGVDVGVSFNLSEFLRGIDIVE